MNAPWSSSSVLDGDGVQWTVPSRSVQSNHFVPENKSEETLRIAHTHINVTYPHLKGIFVKERTLKYMLPHMSFIRALTRARTESDQKDPPSIPKESRKYCVSPRNWQFCVNKGKVFYSTLLTWALSTLKELQKIELNLSLVGRSVCSGGVLTFPVLARGHKVRKKALRLKHTKLEPFMSLRTRMMVINRDLHD